jgi:hypothetical protein
MKRAFFLVVLIPLALVIVASPHRQADAMPQAQNRVFELRTYTANEGKAPDMHKRFREHTCELFKRHGMELVGFWTPIDEKDGKANKLIYLLAFPGREEARKSWKAFSDDPEFM